MGRAVLDEYDVLFAFVPDERIGGGTGLCS